MLKARLLTVEEEDISPLEIRATILGYIGLLPFFAAMLIVYMAPTVFSYTFAGHYLIWCLNYSAIILSFLGGIRWGFVLMDPHQQANEYINLERITSSVIPALLGWLVVVPSNIVASIPSALSLRFGLILLSFIVLMDTDFRASRDGGAPAWYGRLRVKLTLFLGAMLILIILRQLQWGW
ncbi:MAG: DUF3429 domain-containing protein [bacterium]